MGRMASSGGRRCFADRDFAGCGEGEGVVGRGESIGGMDEEPDVASGSWLSQFEDLGRVIGGGEVALELEASGGCAGSERVIEEFDLDILEGDIPDGDPVDGEAFSQVEIQVTGERQAQDGEALPIIAGGRVGGGIGVGGEVVVEVGGSAGEMGGEAGLVDEVDDLGVFVVGAERIIGDGDWADDMTGVGGAGERGHEAQGGGALGEFATGCAQLRLCGPHGAGSPGLGHDGGKLNVVVGAAMRRLCRELRQGV